MNEKEKETQGKWDTLLAQSPKTWTTTSIHTCLDEGVPPGYRRRFWKGLTEWLEVDLNPPLPSYDYVDLLVQPCIYWHTIKIDLHRTFPDVAFFAAGQQGQTLLFKCMKAYSAYDIETGYCQGLGFVCGMFLMQLNEEEAFRMLCIVMFKYGMRQQYMHDMANLKIELYQFSRLVADLLPAVYDHLEKHRVEPIFYTTSWFLSLFSKDFPLEFASVVMDHLLVEGIPMLFKVPIALLSIHQEHLIENCSDLEEIVTYMHTTVAQTDAKTMIAKAHGLDITQFMLDRYAQEFDIMQKHNICDDTVSPVEQGEKIGFLTEKLFDSENERSRLEAQCELLKQQLNHAKSALQGLGSENQAHETTITQLKTQSAKDTEEVQLLKQQLKRVRSLQDAKEPDTSSHTPQLHDIVNESSL